MSEFYKAVLRLEWYYHQALNEDSINNKIAWALYATWKEFNIEKYERRKNERNTNK